MKTAAQLETEITTNLSRPPGILGTTGPKTVQGKQRVAMNCVTHGLTGQNVFLEEAEYPAYMEMGAQYIAELRPVGIRETQLAQKIIDINWRLNTISAVENNLFHGSRLFHVRDDDPNDDRTVAMMSKAAAWQKDCDGPNSFEKLGRYETRLQRALFRLTEEIERMQAVRIKKNSDKFVAEECQAWVWYDHMLALHSQLLATRTAERETAPTETHHATSGPELVGKKSSEPAPAVLTAAASGTVEYAAANGWLTPERGDLPDTRKRSG